MKVVKAIHFPTTFNEYRIGPCGKVEWRAGESDLAMWKECNLNAPAHTKNFPFIRTLFQD